MSSDEVDVLAIGAHPDDVEWGCGGVLAACAASGLRVGIVHLTSGELGSRGSPELRRREAASAAKALGAGPPVFLDCGDGGLRTTLSEENALIDEIRRLRPRLLLAPPPFDRHPDHSRAHRLVCDASFYAGLERRSTGSPIERPAHRPHTLLHYYLHDALGSVDGSPPTMIADISSTWPLKKAALECYVSQFGVGASGSKSEESTETVVSRPEFWAAIEGRARAFGQQIGVEMGEPLGSRNPLAITRVSRLLDLGRP